MSTRKTSIFPLAVTAILVIASFSSCEIFTTPESLGELRLGFQLSSYLSTKTLAEIPDTNDFILKISDSKGKSLYDGAYGASKESIPVESGTYTITVLSSEFSAPKFSAPQYGDKQVVVVNSGKPTDVELLCRQMNSGVRLNIAPEFLTSYPNGSLFLKNDDGKLLYSYSEKRIAYFNPGKVSLVLSNGGTDQTVFSRTLESQEILTLNVYAPGPSSSGKVSVVVDTSRIWTTEDFVIGGTPTTGGDIDGAMNITQAKSNIGAEDVWVYGYIVGGDMTSSNASFKGPFKSRTNIVIGPRSSTDSKESCLSVKLQKGDIRDALNLVDNPDIIGSQVFLKGDIVASYYGIPGIQNITEYKFKKD